MGDDTPDKPKPKWETVVPRPVRVKALPQTRPESVKVKDLPPGMEAGVRLSKYVLGIMAGAIVTLIAYLILNEFIIGWDMHRYYDKVLSGQACPECQVAGRLEQLITDLGVARKDPNLQLPVDSLLNAQLTLQLIDKFQGVTAAEKEHLKACVPLPAANESRNEKLDQCLEGLERIRRLVPGAGSGATSAAVAADASAKLSELRQSFHSFWLQAAQLILLNLLLPLLTALFGYVFGTQHALKE